jgi:hypothetical protein
MGPGVGDKMNLARFFDLNPLRHRRWLTRRGLLRMVERAMNERGLADGGLLVTCSVCGYDLRDLTSDICPECGNRFNLVELIVGQYHLDPAVSIVPPLRLRLRLRLVERVSIVAAILFIGAGSAVGFRENQIRDRYFQERLSGITSTASHQWSRLELAHDYLVLPVGLILVGSFLAWLVVYVMYVRSIRRTRLRLLGILDSLADDMEAERRTED